MSGLGCRRKWARDRGRACNQEPAQVSSRGAAVAMEDAWGRINHPPCSCRASSAGGTRASPAVRYNRMCRAKRKRFQPRCSCWGDARSDINARPIDMAVQRTPQMQGGRPFGRGITLRKTHPQKPGPHAGRTALRCHATLVRIRTNRGNAGLSSGRSRSAHFATICRHLQRHSWWAGVPGCGRTLVRDSRQTKLSGSVPKGCPPVGVSRICRDRFP